MILSGGVNDFTKSLFIFSTVIASANCYADPVSDAEWCLTGDATNRIKNQPMGHGYCLKYVAGWGLHLQKDLAMDAVKAIYCENNVSRAIDYLQICQCHNSYVHDSLPSGADKIKEWGQKRGFELKISCPAKPIVIQPPAPAQHKLNANIFYGKLCNGAGNEANIVNLLSNADVVATVKVTYIDGINESSSIHTYKLPAGATEYLGCSWGAKGPITQWRFDLLGTVP